jgi:hypothetical protein
LGKIQTNTLIPLEELKLALASLCLNKAKLLKIVLGKRKEEKEREMGREEDEIDWENLNEEAIVEYNPFPKTKKSKITVKAYTPVEKKVRNVSGCCLLLKFCFFFTLFFLYSSWIFTAVRNKGGR